jgi:hypothetical protein
MKKLVLFIVFLACVFVLLSISGAPGTLAYSSKPISFRGNIDGFGEAFDEPYWYLTIKATVETDSGNTYKLTYTDLEPPAHSPSQGRQFHIYPENSWWNFVRVDYEVENHEFEALGQINVPAWWVPQHHKRSEDNNGLLLGRMVGVFDITEGGKWEGHDIVSGRADFNFTFAKAEYWAKGGCQDAPCTETVSGTIKGEIIVE